jgi:hypothetical protein
MVQVKSIVQTISLILTVLALSPFTVSAQNGASDTLLRGLMQGLQTGGFVGASDVHVADVAAPRPASAASTDETIAALAAISRLAVKNTDNYRGDFARAFGFEFSGDSLPISNFPRQKGPDSTRYFETTDVSGRLEILIEEASKVDGHTTLISCRVTPQGIIESATRTTKPNGQFQFETIPLPEGEAGCRKILDFWTKYYLENLKQKNPAP